MTKNIQYHKITCSTLIQNLQWYLQTYENEVNAIKYISF